MEGAFDSSGEMDAVSKKLGAGLVGVGPGLVPGGDCLGAEQQDLSARPGVVPVAAYVGAGMVGPRGTGASLEASAGVVDECAAAVGLEWPEPGLVARRGLGARDQAPALHSGVPAGVPAAGPAGPGEGSPAVAAW
ncbi:hypothetical protein D3C80_1166160 [compost metagenome]